MLPPASDSAVNMMSTAMLSHDRNVRSAAKNVLGSTRVRTTGLPEGRKLEAEVMEGRRPSSGSVAAGEPFWPLPQGHQPLSAVAAVAGLSAGASKPLGHQREANVELRLGLKGVAAGAAMEAAVGSTDGAGAGAMEPSTTWAVWP